MTKKELEQSKKAIETLTKKVTASRASARRHLISMGVITKSGNLTVNYK